MYTRERSAAMLMHIDLDAALVEETMQLGDHATKKAAVNAALAEYVRLLKRRRLLEQRGRIPWQGSLDRMRERAPK